MRKLKMFKKKFTFNTKVMVIKDGFYKGAKGILVKEYHQHSTGIMRYDVMLETRLGKTILVTFKRNELK